MKVFRIFFLVVLLSFWSMPSSAFIGSLIQSIASTVVNSITGSGGSNNSFTPSSSIVPGSSFVMNTGGIGTLYSLVEKTVIDHDIAHYIELGAHYVELYLGSAQPANITIVDPKITEMQDSTAMKARRLQNRLALYTTFRKSTIFGSHNSYNSMAYQTAIRYLDPQQHYSIYDQLRIGVRYVELDVHYTGSAPNLADFTNYKKHLLLCHTKDDEGAIHLGCSVHDRYVGLALMEINSWLMEPSNSSEVLIIYVEAAVEDQARKLYNIFLQHLGHKIYFSGSCDRDMGSLTPAKILAAGKQVVVYISSDTCQDSASIQSMMFDFSNKGVSVKNEDLTTVAKSANQSIIWSASDVVRDQNEGKNILAFDNITVGKKYFWSMWTWQKGYPKDNDQLDCAFSELKGQGAIKETEWRHSSCDEERAYTCHKKQGDGWKVTNDVGVWDIDTADTLCQEVGEGYYFAVPKSARENARLARSMNESGVDTVWLKYREVKEGEWKPFDKGDRNINQYQPVIVYGDDELRCLSAHDFQSHLQLYHVGLVDCYRTNPQLWKYDARVKSFTSKSGHCLILRHDEIYAANSCQGIDKRERQWKWENNSLVLYHDQDVSLGLDSSEQAVVDRHSSKEDRLNLYYGINICAHHNASLNYHDNHCVVLEERQDLHYWQLDRNYYYSALGGDDPCPHHNAVFDGANCLIFKKIHGIDYNSIAGELGYTPLELLRDITRSERERFESYYDEQRCPYHGAQYHYIDNYCKIFTKESQLSYWKYYNGYYYTALDGENKCPYHNAGFDGANCLLFRLQVGINYQNYGSDDSVTFGYPANEGQTSILDTYEQNNYFCRYYNAELNNDFCSVLTKRGGVAYWGYHGGYYYSPIQNSGSPEERCPYHNASFDGANCLILRSISGVRYYVKDNKIGYDAEHGSELSVTDRLALYDQFCPYYNATFRVNDNFCVVFTKQIGVHYWGYYGGYYYSPVQSSGDSADRCPYHNAGFDGANCLIFHSRSGADYRLSGGSVGYKAIR